MFNSLFFKNRRLINVHSFFKEHYKNYFKIHAFDVLHVHFADNAVSIASLIKGFDKKTVVTFHGFDAHKYNTHFFEPLLKIKDVIYTANTNYTLNKVVALGFKKNNINVLPVSLDTNFFSPFKTTNNKIFKVLFVGRLIPLKAPLFAIKIIHQFINKVSKKTQFHIVGAGPQKRDCLEYVEKYRLEESVFFHGKKTQEEVKQLMNSSNVFLFPGTIDETGRSEGQGLVLQEAQAMELPVITTNFGGIKDGVLDKKSGYIIKDYKIEKFIEALKELYNSKELRKVMGENGRRFVVENYDNKIILNQLLKIYK